MSWYLNPDTEAAADEWANWLRYTRNKPVYSAGTTEQIAGYTPEEKTMSVAVHESAHAVLYLAAGCQVKHISLHGQDANERIGQAVTVVASVPASCRLIPGATAIVAGERAEDRWLRETGRWSPGRAWVAERLAWMDRRQLHGSYRASVGSGFTFRGDRSDWGDYAWFHDRADEALDNVWEQVLTLARYVAEHRHVTGDDAAQIAGVAG